MKFATTLMMAAALFLSMGFSSAARIQPVLFGASEHSQLPVSMTTGMQPNASTNYIVKPGQTLSGLSKAYNTTTTTLEQKNPSLKKNNNQVYAGERLNIPNADEGPTVVVAPASGVPGTQIEVVLGGFPANTNVQLALDQITCSQRSITNMTTDQNGQLTTQMTIPQIPPSSQEYKRLGQWDVIAVAQNASAASSMGSSTGNTANSSGSAASSSMNSSSNATSQNSASNSSAANSGSMTTGSSSNSASNTNSANSSSMTSSASMIVVSSNVFNSGATNQLPIPNSSSSGQ